MTREPIDPAIHARRAAETGVSTSDDGSVVQMHPGYHEGFWDAQGLEPLFDDASPEYAAGWRGFWECRRLLDETTQAERRR